MVPSTLHTVLTGFPCNTAWNWHTKACQASGQRRIWCRRVQVVARPGCDSVASSASWGRWWSPAASRRSLLPPATPHRHRRRPTTLMTKSSNFEILACITCITYLGGRISEGEKLSLLLVHLDTMLWEMFFKPRQWDLCYYVKWLQPQTYPWPLLLCKMTTTIELPFFSCPAHLSFFSFLFSKLRVTSLNTTCPPTLHYEQQQKWVWPLPT